MKSSQRERKKWRKWSVKKASVVHMLLLPRDRARRIFAKEGRKFLILLRAFFTRT